MYKSSETPFVPQMRYYHMYVFLGLFTLCSLPLYEYMLCGRNPEANSLSKQVTHAIKRTIIWQTSFIPCHTGPTFLYCKEIVCCMQHTALYQWPEFVNQMKKSKYWVSLYLDHMVLQAFGITNIFRIMIYSHRPYTK